MECYNINLLHRIRKMCGLELHRKYLLRCRWQHHHYRKKTIHCHLMLRQTNRWKTKSNFIFCYCPFFAFSKHLIVLACAAPYVLFYQGLLDNFWRKKKFFTNSNETLNINFFIIFFSFLLF